MSASERLRELKVGDGVSLYALEEALPEIVAVVEAAEADLEYLRANVIGTSFVIPETTLALANAITALEEKLKHDHR